MSKRQLLLVDGDARTLEVMGAALRKAGFLVTTAANGREALARLELGMPELVLSETQMPEVDGFELCQRVKADARFSALPFLFLSAQKTVDQKLRGLELGCDDYLTKPMFIKEIVARIDLLLSKRPKESSECSTAEDGHALCGTLSEMGIVDLVQTIDLSRKSGTLRVETGGLNAALYLEEGKIVDAEFGPHRGEAAFYRLLNVSEGRFELRFAPQERPDRIGPSTQALLVEGMRRSEAWGRLCERLPPLSTVLIPEFALVAEQLAVIPDELNPVLRMVDGDRTITQLVHESALDDLVALEAVAQLVEAKLLVELAQSEAGVEPQGAVAGSSAPATSPQSPEGEGQEARASALAADEGRGWFESP